MTSSPCYKHKLWLFSKLVLFLDYKVQKQKGFTNDNKKHNLGQAGIAHLGLIIFLIFVIAVGVVGYQRVQKADDTKSSASNSAEEKLQAEMDDSASSASQDTNVTTDKEAEL